MKTQFIIFISTIIIISFSCTAQTDISTLKFKVSGNCEMCKKTIENSLGIKGVKSANWNQDTKIIEVVYNTTKINEDRIHEAIAASGYDTDKKKADAQAYKDLPECCQYTKSK